MRNPSWSVTVVAVLSGTALLWNGCGGAPEPPASAASAEPTEVYTSEDEVLYAEEAVAEEEPAAEEAAAEEPSIYAPDDMPRRHLPADRQRKRAMKKIDILKREVQLLRKLYEETDNNSAPPAVDLADLGIDAMGADEIWVVARFDKETPTRSSSSIGAPALRTVIAGEPEYVPLPLRHTSVDARINTYIAAVTVEQQYHNPYSDKIEVEYVFPLPQNAAVSEFLMKVGNRTIRGIIRERQQAEQIYKEARAAGHTASLLTQERPNVFTQKVANIEPQKDIDIELTYFNTLPYRDGAYVFTFPTVVGPRYNPPGSADGIGAVPSGTAVASGQQTEVQYLAPDEESSHDVSMTIALDAGVSIEKVFSPTHNIEIEVQGSDRRKITLQDRTMAPDRDFVLKYEVAGKALKKAFITHEDNRGGFFTMVLTPPEEITNLKRAPSEHIFVLDCSGSMNGWPMEVAKDTVEQVLEKLDEEDTFQIIRFSNNASSLGPRPIPATRANIRRGLRYLSRLDGSGGTEMITGLKAALNFPHEEGKVRIVTFLTDGFIGNEADILAAVKRNLGQSRIFSFGVGSSPNRYLLERMAKLGQGAVAYVGQSSAREDQKAVEDFYKRASHPALSDISLDFGGARVSEVYPSRIPDVYAGRPVVVTGRYQGRLERNVTVHGRIGGEKSRFSVPAERSREAVNPAVAQIWARMKIMDMADRSLWSSGAERARLYNDIKSLALTYELMSKFTAFIAVDAARKTAGTHGYTVAQPVSVPHGVRYDTTVSE